MAHVSANHFPGGPQSGSLADALYKELWNACVLGLVLMFPVKGNVSTSLKDTWNRPSRSPFIISLNKYLEAQSYRLSAGMKVKMYGSEEVLEKRISGTIVGVGNTAGSKYEASKRHSILCCHLIQIK